MSIFGEWIQVRFYLTLLFTNFKISWEISDFFLSWVGKNIGGPHVEEISDLRKKNLKTSLSLRKSIYGGTVGWEKLKSSEKTQIWENFSVVGPEARILTLYKHPSLYSMFTRPLYIMHIKHKWSQCCLFWWIFYHLLLHAYVYIVKHVWFKEKIDFYSYHLLQYPSTDVTFLHYCQANPNFNENILK